MPFLRNAWYMAGWAEQLSDKPLRIKILGRGIALYRLSNGEAVAIGDRCAHRFASLGDGKIVNDSLQCPYHGLRYDRTGQCVHNPHGDGAIPPRARVDSYRLIERHHGLWIWMGDPGLADPLKIPDFSLFDRADLASSRDRLYVRANYELVSDNLLDLSHAAYLHPFLATEGLASRSRTEVKRVDTTVWSFMWNDNEPVTPLFKLVWDGNGDRGDLRSHMRWTAPCNLYLDVGMTDVAAVSTESGPWLPSAHLLTPETESSTHYFWMIARNRQQTNEELGKIIHQGISRAFTTEDEPMISRIFENMNGEDFRTLRPAMLPGDTAASLARRVLSTMIADESVHESEAQHPQTSNIA